MIATALPTEYRVELPLYRGPLDLLLYLVKKHEVDILDIPISIVARSYLSYLEVIQLIDIEAAGDFLVVASTLMEIKSRMLLPQLEDSGETAEGEDTKLDPRAELVKQLVAYRRFREASDELDHLAAQQASFWPRGLHEKTKSACRSDAAATTAGGVVGPRRAAFDRLLRATLTHQLQAIEADETPQYVHMERMLEQLQSATDSVPF